MSDHFFQIPELPALAVPDKRFVVHYISTDNMTVAFNALKAGAEVPEHDHIHETIDIIQEGSIEMTIDGNTVIMTEGMIAKVPSLVRHSAKALTDCRVVNIFYPVRDDFHAVQDSVAD